MNRRQAIATAAGGIVTWGMWGIRIPSGDPPELKFRKVFVCMPDLKWVEVPFLGLKKGQTFVYGDDAQHVMYDCLEDAFPIGSSGNGGVIVKERHPAVEVK